MHIHTYGQPATIHMYTPARTYIQTYIELSLYTNINSVTVQEILGGVMNNFSFLKASYNYAMF